MARLRLSPPDRIVFSTALDVRVTDLNYGRHLGHMELIGLLHQARVEFLGSLGMSEIDVEGHALMVVDLAVTYRAEVFAGQTLVIDIGLEFEGSRGVTFTYGVRDRATNRTVAVAKTGVLFADPRDGGVAQIPESFRVVVERGSHE